VTACVNVHVRASVWVCVSKLVWMNNYVSECERIWEWTSVSVYERVHASEWVTVCVSGWLCVWMSGSMCEWLIEWVSECMWVQKRVRVNVLVNEWLLSVKMFVSECECVHEKVTTCVSRCLCVREWLCEWLSERARVCEWAWESSSGRVNWRVIEWVIVCVSVSNWVRVFMSEWEWVWLCLCEWD
jgi:hypothetical protein